MKYYEKMIALGSFCLADVVEMTESVNAAKFILESYVNRGLIERVRRNYYVAISLETHQPVFNRYQIASNIYPDAYLTHHSAFEAYGYANQIFYNVYFTSKKKVSDFFYDGISYEQTLNKQNAFIVKNGNIKMTSIEQTVIDSIKDYEKIAGLEETLRCIELIPALDQEIMLRCLENYNNGFLYQKCGYLFENLGKIEGITDTFAKTCLAHISRSKRYLVRDRNDLIYNSKWMLYTPVRLRSLIEKGDFGYDAKDKN